MLVRNCMSKRLVTVAPEDSVADAQALLAKHGIHHLPVLKGQRLVGIVTDRDVRSAAANTASNLSDLAARSDQHVRRKPLERGRERSIEKTPAAGPRVADIMTAKPQTVAPDTFVDEAAGRLRRHRIGALPVVEKGRLVGILTAADVLDAFVDLSGVREPTTQIVVAGAKGSKAAEQVREAVRKARGELKWLQRDANDPSRLFLRLKTARVDDIEYALEAAGFTVPTIISNARRREQ